MPNQNIIKDKLHLLEYSFLKLAQWEMERLGYDKTIQFLERNSFSKNKMLLLPFFICTANGEETKRPLFEIFSQFKAEEIGYVEQDIKDYFNESCFVIPQIVDRIAEFKLNNSNLSDFNLIDNKLLDEFKSNNPLENRPRNGSIFNCYYEFIDHSISVYKDNKWFIGHHDEIDLIKICKKHSGWQIYQTFDNLKVEIINTEILIAEKSVYSKELKDRMLV